MKRRELLLAAAALAIAPAARAHPPGKSSRPRLIAVAVPGAPNPANAGAPTLRKRLADLGWVEGRDVEYVFGYDHGDSARHEKMIADLLARKPAVLFVVFGNMALVAMKQTREVPIVFAVSSNPEKIGLVATLARPGGNVTGVSTREVELLGKRIELMREISPGIRRIAVLTNPNSPMIAETYVSKHTEQAAKFGIQVIVAEARASEELRPAFDKIAREGAQGLLTVADGIQLQLRDQITAHAARLRLVAVYVGRDFVEAGGLASYGTNREDQVRRAAGHVDKILRGAKPADLPVEEPTHFHLAVNLKAARAQGLKMPQSVLVRADEVVE